MYFQKSYSLIVLLNSNCVFPQSKNATEHFKLKMAPLRHTTKTNWGRWPLQAATEMHVGVFYNDAIGCSVQYWGRPSYQTPNSRFSS